MISLKEAMKFHGHLGPYLVLGLLAGALGLKKTGAKKYFGLEVKVYGANIKPKSCLIDGLQLSTGATYGKGNIRKYASSSLKIKSSLLKELDNLKGHNDSEKFARRLLDINSQKIFTLK